LSGLDRFNIKFIHLKPGRYQHHFAIENAFFDNFEHSLVDKASIEVQCTLIKEKETRLRFLFQMDGSLKLTCDRCLDAFDYPIHLNEALLVKITDEAEEEANQAENDDDDVQYLPTDAIAFNVAKPIFDYLNLTKPMKPICEEVNKQCNEDMMRILNNMQKQSDKSEDDVDPRWEELKKLYNKNNKN